LTPHCAISLFQAIAFIVGIALMMVAGAAFVCGVIAFRRGQRGLGSAGIALAALGFVVDFGD
jgi:hypothetical protein